MDTAALLWIVKGIVIFAGLVVYLAVVVKHYGQVADEMAGEIAEAALARDRHEQPAGPRPRVTLTPADASDDDSA